MDQFLKTSCYNFTYWFDDVRTKYVKTKYRKTKRHKKAGGFLINIMKYFLFICMGFGV